LDCGVHLPKSEDKVVVRVEDLRLKERINESAHGEAEQLPPIP